MYDPELEDEEKYRTEILPRLKEIEADMMADFEKIKKNDGFPDNLHVLTSFTIKRLVILEYINERLEERLANLRVKIVELIAAVKNS